MVGNMDNKELKISIITVCLNSERYLERTIKSVIGQTYKNIEYIVIDGGSVDNTHNIVNKYKDKIDCFISEKDAGIYDAMNKGIGLAKGDFLYFLNSDDQIYSAGTIEKAASYLKTRKVDFLYGDMLCHDQNGSDIILKRYPKRLNKRFFLRGPLGHSSTFFHRSCFEKVGYFDTRYKISGDYEWYLRGLFNHRLKAQYIEEIVSVFQLGGASRDTKILLSEMKSVQKLYFSFFDFFIGSYVNFIFCGDIFRYIARFLLQNKGYSFFRNRSRRLKGINVSDLS